jgi:hypothetical protein
MLGKTLVFSGMLIARSRFTKAMKKAESNTSFDQNWAWPEKTWFRERLNALRAREEQNHRKAVSARKNPATVEAKPGNDRGHEED